MAIKAKGKGKSGGAMVKTDDTKRKYIPISYNLSQPGRCFSPGLASAPTVCSPLVPSTT